jgi:hypothetical protein
MPLNNLVFSFALVSEDSSSKSHVDRDSCEGHTGCSNLVSVIAGENRIRIVVLLER